jgi:hypothetical protein
MQGGSVRVKPGKNDWRTGPDDTLQVVNPKSKEVKVRLIALTHHSIIIQREEQAGQG